MERGRIGRILYTLQVLQWVVLAVVLMDVVLIATILLGPAANGWALVAALAGVPLLLAGWTLRSLRRSRLARFLGSAQRRIRAHRDGPGWP